MDLSVAENFQAEILFKDPGSWFFFKSQNANGFVTVDFDQQQSSTGLNIPLNIKTYIVSEVFPKLLNYTDNFKMVFGRTVLPPSRHFLCEKKPEKKKVKICCISSWNIELCASEMLWFCYIMKSAIYCSLLYVFFTPSFNKTEMQQ